MLTPTSRPSTICRRPARVAMPACQGMSPPLTAFTAIFCRRTGDSRASTGAATRTSPGISQKGIRSLAVMAPRPGTVYALLTPESSRKPPSTNTRPSLDSSTTPSMPKPTRAANSMPEVALTPSSPGPNPWVNNPPRNPVDKPTKVPISVRKRGSSPGPLPSPGTGVCLRMGTTRAISLRLPAAVGNCASLQTLNESASAYFGSSGLVSSTLPAKESTSCARLSRTAFAARVASAGFMKASPWPIKCSPFHVVNARPRSL